MAAGAFRPRGQPIVNPRPTVRVSAMVTAYRRVDEAIQTLTRINACVPAPAETLVHVDGGQHAAADAIARACPWVRVVVSEMNVGPGGGRNTLVEAARNDVIASFDDDSYPIDSDYFARVLDAFASHPEAWVVSARIFDRRESIPPDTPSSEWVADFGGGGCAYRRARYLETGGYVPLPTAYGMEEVDFGLRLHTLGGRVLRVGRLRVFHDTNLAHHSDPQITSASIVNLALLAYLRYPWSLWAVGAVQCANRIQWLVRHGRRRGVLAGLAAIPGTLAKYRHQRRPLPSKCVRSFLALRRRALRA